MGAAILVSEHIDFGRRLLTALDARGLPVTAAYWFLSFDGTEWTYVVSTPRLDESASFEPYRIVNEVIDQLHAPQAISPIETHLMGEHQPIIVNLRAFAATGDGRSVRERKIVGESVGGSYIVGAYLYRVKQFVPETGTAAVNFAYKMDDKWKVKPGELVFREGRLIGLSSEEKEFAEIAIRPRALSNGLSTQFRTVEAMLRKGMEDQVVVRAWQFSNGQLVGLREEIDPRSMRRMTRAK